MPAARALLALLLLLGCDRRPDTGPVIASVIGATEERHLVAAATAQGLVRFDAAGQVEPGLAERWIVTDEGRSYIFRLRPARWSDGRPVTADQVAAILRRRIARADNPLRPFLRTVAEVVAMTPEVLEVRLSRQRPDLLKLFAHPSLGILRAGRGTGPFRIAAAAPLLLRPIAMDVEAPPTPEQDVRLLPERAALAVARFRAGRSDLVTGGGFADWPLLGTARVRPAEIRTDPATGLFGLAVVRREGFLADPANRRALSGAIDRAAITAAVAQGWEPAERIVPDRLDMARSPAIPGWSLLTPDQRRSALRTHVAAWPEPVVLRVALPSGPGATLLWGGIARSLRGGGIAGVRVGPDAPADLRLVDVVAPYDSGRWFLHRACRPCSADAVAALDAARDAPTMAERSEQLSRADALVDADAPFIPIAHPWRWSLVSRRLRAWTPNGRGVHPLNHLRAEPN